MVRQTWYQVNGTRRTGPPPKYIIPDKHFIQKINIRKCRSSYFKSSIPLVDAIILPIGLPASSFSPVELIPSCIDRNWKDFTQKNLCSSKGLLCSSKDFFALKNDLVFIAIATAIHHGCQHHFDWVNSWRIEPGNEKGKRWQDLDDTKNLSLHFFIYSFNWQD